MEIRARYVQIGAVTLAVLFAGFAFVYWLNNAGTLRDRAVYQVRFASSVSGLVRGSAVLCNGLRVGDCLPDFRSMGLARGHRRGQRLDHP